MTATPAVSVLLPVRDARPFLGLALRSLARQTLVQYEVVAIDDGSADGSGSLLDEWAMHDARFRVLHSRREGLVAALNRGLERCRAPLVARLDADDACHPKRLEQQVEWLATHPEVGVVSCLVEHVPRHSIARGFRVYEEWLNSLRTHDDMTCARFVESPVAHPSVVFRRQTVEDVGGYRDCGWPEDYDLWLRLFERGVRFDKVPRTLVFWRDHEDRLSRRDDRYAKKQFLRCKAEFLVRGPLAGCERVVVWGAGPTGSVLARSLLEVGVAAVAFVDIDTRKIGSTRYGVPIVAPKDLPALLSRGAVVLAAVASRGARELIRGRLTALGLTEGREFWCVA